MCRGARAFRRLSAAGILTTGLVVGAGLAHAEDPFNNLAPLPESQLKQSSGQGVNFIGDGNTVVNNATKESGSIDHTSMNGQFNNGGIAGNTLSNNQGLTSVMMNSGNNVNMNNSFTVNVIMH